MPDDFGGASRADDALGRMIALPGPLRSRSMSSVGRDNDESPDLGPAAGSIRMSLSLGGLRFGRGFADARARGRHCRHFDGLVRQVDRPRRGVFRSKPARGGGGGQEFVGVVDGFSRVQYARRRLQPGVATFA